MSLFSLDKLLDMIVDEYTKEGYKLTWYNSITDLTRTLKLSKVMPDRREYYANHTMTDEMLQQVIRMPPYQIANIFDAMMVSMEKQIIKEFKNYAGPL